MSEMNPPQEATVFFVDDEPAIRKVVQRTLEISGYHVKVFSCAEDCLTSLSEKGCDVVVTDVRLEGMDGLALLREIRRRFPWLPIIIATGYGDTRMAVAAMKGGAADFIEKPLDRQELLSAIQEALKTAVKPQPSLLKGLSDTEAHVLHLILDGKTSRDVALALNRSIRTVEAHRHRIMKKLGAKNVAQLIQRADAMGFAHTRPAALSQPAAAGNP
ncbi:MAG: hypothetical protein A2Y77_06770 [Planctomycetes bacterium RBG_13_62_9]|nr:MAG: hypothetical protein A2Y77_06770 [Planctomycetes bacterium RBG_13_62_9]